MAIWTLLAMLASAAAADDTAALMARASAVTSPTIRCSTATRPGEVVVCARRRADGYRLPLIDRTAGSRADPTPAQRVAATRPESNCATKSVFLVGCGSVGVGTTISSDGKRRVYTQRERTPDTLP